MSENNKVYLSFGRHGRYGMDTAIDHTSMVEAFCVGRRMAKIFPACRTVFHSPLRRAELTAKFRGLGLDCPHIICRQELEEETPKFTIRQFVDNVIKSAEKDERHFHFVTHLPVIEKLGLPDLSTCGVCWCEANNWGEMLAENYEVRVLPEEPKEEMFKVLQKIMIAPEDLWQFSPNAIYSALNRVR